MKQILIAIASMFGCVVFAENCATEWHNGEATYYGGVAGTDGGNCRIYVEEGDFKHCAMNQTDYDGSRACGTCVHIVGPIGEIDLKVVDRCPECKEGDIDMTPDAFEQIAKKEAGRVAMKWYYIACPDEKIKFQFVSSMNQWYFDLAVLNHRYEISEFYALNSNGEWQKINRSMDNHWQVITGDIPQPPYTFKLVTNVTGEELIIKDIPLVAGGEYETDAQFSMSECDESGIHSFINDNEDFLPPYEVYAMDGTRLGLFNHIPNKKGVLILKSTVSGKAVKVVLK